MTDLTSIQLNKADQSPTTLGEWDGKVLLVVNVASKCGLTPQYEALQKLHDHYAAQAFSVIGMPANDFKEQEPGSDAEIQEFCQVNYGVTFPVLAKIVVTGTDKHPLYKALTAAHPETPDRERFATALKGYGIEPTAAPEVLWNFEKFLIGKNGAVIARFSPDTAPDDAAIAAAIEAALAA
ncbi:glutathione peroxidase [Porticoccaceae bacterium]|nr:glutathione peroxidase [Porticoccaceae bacterium]